ncbi:MAG: hypothetical protein HC880_05235 [Bacteroidia bacterium]|nr:hypothetical protein [Bacteroidia bacterium]
MKKLNVLLADPDPESLHTAFHILDATEQFNVMSAHNTELLYRILNCKVPDLLILTEDILLNDPKHLSDYIHKPSSEKKIPVLALRESKRSDKSNLNPNVSAYFVKPLSKARFLEAIVQLLEQESLVSKDESGLPELPDALNTEILANLSELRSSLAQQIQALKEEREQIFRERIWLHKEKARWKEAIDRLQREQEAFQIEKLHLEKESEKLATEEDHFYAAQLKFLEDKTRLDEEKKQFDQEKKALYHLKDALDKQQRILRMSNSVD